MRWLRTSKSPDFEWDVKRYEDLLTDVQRSILSTTHFMDYLSEEIVTSRIQTNTMQ